MGAVVMMSSLSPAKRMSLTVSFIRFQEGGDPTDLARFGEDFRKKEVLPSAPKNGQFNKVEGWLCVHVRVCVRCSPNKSCR